MEANKNYWRAPPKIDEMIFAQSYTNEDRMAQELKAGAIDGATKLRTRNYRAFPTTPG